MPTGPQEGSSPWLVLTAGLHLGVAGPQAASQEGPCLMFGNIIVLKPLLPPDRLLFQVTAQGACSSVSDTPVLLRKGPSPVQTAAAPATGCLASMETAYSSLPW